MAIKKNINKNDSITRNEFHETGVVATTVKGSRVLADNKSERVALTDAKRVFKDAHDGFKSSVAEAKRKHTAQLRDALDAATARFAETAAYFGSDDYAVGVRKHLTLARIVHDFDIQVATVKNSPKLSGRSLKDVVVEKSVVDASEVKNIVAEFKRRNGFIGRSGNSKFSQFKRIGAVADELEAVAERLPSGWAFLSELVATVYRKDAAPVSVSEFLDYTLTEYVYSPEELANRPSSLDGSHVKGRKVLWALRITPQSTLSDLRLLRRYFFGDADAGVLARSVEYIAPTKRTAEPPVAAVTVETTVVVDEFRAWMSEQSVTSEDDVLAVLGSQVSALLKKSFPFLNVRFSEFNSTLAGQVSQAFAKRAA